MDKNMKFLVIVFIAILYFTPNMMTNLTSTILGKATLLGFIMVIAHMYGKKATIFASIIAILLLQHSNETVENMDNMKDTMDMVQNMLNTSKDLEKAMNGESKETDNTTDQVENSDKMRKGQSSKDVADMPNANVASPELANGETEEKSGLIPDITSVTEGFAMLG